MKITDIGLLLHRRKNVSSNSRYMMLLREILRIQDHVYVPEVKCANLEYRI